MSDLRAQTLTRPASTNEPNAARAITPPAWAAEGVCSKDGRPDLWFPRYVSEEREAIALCHTCPMERRCDQWATETGERWGVWGGRVRGDKRGGAL